MVTFYTFNDFQDKYVLTSETNELNIYNSYRLFPVNKPVYKNGRKSRKKFNIVEITDGRYGYHDASGMYIVERKYLTEKVLKHVISCVGYGDRTKDKRPVEADILDSSLLDNFVITEYEWVYTGYNPPYHAIRYVAYNKQEYTDHEQEIKAKIERYHQRALECLERYRQEQSVEKKYTNFKKI